MSPKEAELQSDLHGLKARMREAIDEASKTLDDPESFGDDYENALVRLRDDLTSILDTHEEL